MVLCAPLFLPLVIAALLTPFGRSQPTAERCLLQTTRSGAAVNAQSPLEARSPSPKAHSEGEPDEDNFSTDTGDLAAQVTSMMKDIDMLTGTERHKTSVEVRTTVDAMVASFKSMAVSRFKRAFNHTQKAINAYGDELERKAQRTVNAKWRADGASEVAGKCRQEELARLRVHERCANELQWAERSKKSACKAQEKAQYYNWEIDRHLATGHNCDVSEENCTEELQKQVDHLNEEEDRRRAHHARQEQNCRNLTAVVRTKSQECVDVLTAFHEQKAACEAAEFVVRNETCIFGSSFQEACSQYANMTELVKEVKHGKGTEYSEADRQQHWKDAETMICELKSYSGGGTADESVRSLCEGSSNYNCDIGNMNYQGDRVMTIMKTIPPCKAQHVSLRGPAWEFAKGKGAEGYKSLPSRDLEIKLQPVGSASFHFCQASASRDLCQYFQCPHGWAAKRDAASRSCILSSCSKYECCDAASL